MDKRVLVLSAFDGPYAGSFITALLALENYLYYLPQNERYEVVYAFPSVCEEFDWFKELKKEGKKIYTYSDRSIIGGLKFIQSVVKTERITLIHTHFEALGRSIYLFSLLHRKIPVIWHKRNDFSLGDGSMHSLKRRIKDLIIDKLVVTVSISKHLQTKRGYLVYEPLILSRIPDNWQNRSNHIKDMLGLPNNSKVILMFGWNKQVKGVDIACHMMDSLPDALKATTHLCVVAKNDDENKEFAANNCSIPENIHFLPNESDVFKYHCSAEIMLSASRSEAFSNTMLEAMAVGTQVVSSDIPGVQWSKAYNVVRYFENGNPESCAKAITECLTSGNSVSNVEIAKSVQKDFDIVNWCRKISEIYSTVLN